MSDFTEIIKIEEDLEFESWFKHQRESFEQHTKPKNKADLLYHYTNLSGLLGILENQAFWASNINFINDATECSHGISIYDKVLTDLRFSFNKKFKDKVKGLSDYFKNEQNKIYSISFCEERDLLSQWRGYCQDNIGFSLGIRNKDLRGGWEYEIMPGIIEKYRENYSFKKVIYDEKFASEIIEKRLCDFNLFFESRTMNERQWERAMGLLVNHVPLFKNCSFKEEKEWRIVYFEHEIILYNRIINQQFNLSSNIIKFRTRNDLILPYIEIKADGNLPIEEIVIGPSPKQEDIENNLKFYLKKKKLNDIKIIRSEIPYRG